jgi:hypothetical protein
MNDEAILAYLAEYRAFDLAHRVLVQATTGAGTLPGITKAETNLRASLHRLQYAWGMLSVQERIGLIPPPSAG